MSFHPAIRPGYYLLLVVVAFFAVGNGVRHNASDPIHWDVPIYLLDAKMELTQGPLLQRMDGEKILANLPGREETGQFRRISRYGNVWIIAQVLRAGPGGEAGVARARAVYSLLMLVFLVILYLFLAWIIPATGGRPNYGGAAVVVLLIVGTPLFRYLNGNLVSEVPALILTTLSCLIFGWGLTTGRGMLCGLGGVFLFLAYAVRMDAILLPVFMVIAGLWLVPRLGSWQWYVRGSLLFAGAFGLCLLAYVLLAGSVVSPHNFLRFVLHASPQHFQLTSEEGAAVVARSLAPLLPLAMVALIGGNRRVLLFSFTWLLLAVLPFAVLVLRGAWIETRFLSMAWLPLAVICCLGTDRFREWFQRLPGRRLPSIASGAGAAVLVMGSLLLFSETGCLWAKDAMGLDLAVPANEKRVYGIHDIQKVVDEVGRSGGRFNNLILPKASPIEQCLFSYCHQADKTGGREETPQVFGALRTGSRETDLKQVRWEATTRLGVSHANKVKVRNLYKGEDWVLVALTAKTGTGARAKRR